MRLQPADPGSSESARDGTDVFFGTFDTLVRQDNNGLFLKFYDARSGGGFSAPAPPPRAPPPTSATGGQQPPAALVNGTGTALGSGGNVVR